MPLPPRVIAGVLAGRRKVSPGRISMLPLDQRSVISPSTAVMMPKSRISGSRADSSGWIISSVKYSSFRMRLMPLWR